MRSDEETDGDAGDGSESGVDDAPAATPGDEATGTDDHRPDEADEPDAYEDLPDGCGCAEMWERTSERRGTD